MTNPLTLELHHHEYLRQKLLEEFPDADEQTLKDTLEGLSDLNEKLAAVARSQHEDRILADALKTRISQMHDRLARFEHRINKKRDLIALVMDRAGIKKITEPDFTLSLRTTPPALVVLDERSIPETYWKPQPSKLDRRQIAQDLKDDKPVPGAILGNGGVSISMRVS